ncbi:MAG TPA: carboxylating nicotinate-nucleotide diphosphorylase [Chthoniobacterales bacterium]|nr:carboxylating nicotinate-nucleotide diphosphorylase [Chthoniobacterales bacterium]
MNPDPIDIALQEDVGRGDVTSEFFVPASARASGRIVAREAATIAGTQTAAEVFRRVDPNTHVDVISQDGALVNAEDIVLEVAGLARALLQAERVALNFLQHLSGIATLTRNFVDAAANEHVKILDTRKTTPGLRALDKAAVLAGGGANHRFGLFDMVLVKNNHLGAHPGLAAFQQALAQFRATRPDVQIEVEADSLARVRALLELEGVDVILLDNMKPAQVREAVALGKGKVKFEASGGVTLKNVRQIAATGVDYISVGALTHSARAIDLALELTYVSA